MDRREGEALLRAVAGHRVRRDPAHGAWSPYWLDRRDVSAGMRALAALALVRLPLLGPPELTDAGRLTLAPAGPEASYRSVVEVDGGAEVGEGLRRWRVTFPVPARPVGPGWYRHLEVVDAHLLERHHDGAAVLKAWTPVLGEPRLVTMLYVHRGADIEPEPLP